MAGAPMTASAWRLVSVMSVTPQPDKQIPETIHYSWRSLPRASERLGDLCAQELTEASILDQQGPAIGKVPINVA
jgi:hypothetical protein